MNNIQPPATMPKIRIIKPKSYTIEQIAEEEKKQTKRHQQKKPKL